MKSRIVWSRAELVAVGMSFDRLKSDPTVCLLPDFEILRMHAQVEALPLERRRVLSQIQAMSILARIDKMRDEQEYQAWTGAESDDPEAPSLPTDSLELLAINAARKELKGLESAILTRVETLLMDSERRMRDFFTSQFNLLVKTDPSIDKVSIVPAEPVAQQRVLVLYPAEASWASGVPKAIAALRRERWSVVATAIDTQNNTFADLSVHDAIFVIDAMQTTVCEKRVRAMLAKKDIVMPVQVFHCATREQIVSHVKAALLASARRAA